MAGRIPQEEIDRIKREVPVVDVVRARGIELHGHGDNLLGLCPFHPDKTPSLVISPSKNLWNCLGACGGGGDVLAWIMKAEHVPFLRAVELAQRGYPHFTDALKRGPREKKDLAPCPIAPEMSDREMLDAVMLHYQQRLNASDNSEAVRLLEKRGIWSEEAIEHFRIGFGDRSLGTLLPGPELKAGKELRRRLAEIGVYRADSGREHFNGCIVFPVVQRDGEISEIYGRKIRDDVRHRVGRHVYLPGPHRGIWNGEALRETKELVVCEAIIDALTFWIHGHRNVIAAYGVNGFTDEMFEAVQANAIEKVFIAFDRDEAGDKGAASLAERLGEAGIASYRVLFPRMMDANEYAKKVQPAAQSLGVALRSAEYMSGPKSRGAAIVSPGPVPSSLIRHPVYAEPSFLKVVPQPVEQDEPGAPIEPPPLPVEEIVPPEADEPLSPPLDAVPAVTETTATDYTDVVLTLGDRHYRIRGLEKNLSYGQLKLVVRVARGELVFLDQVDLVSARARAQFVKAAAVDLGLKEAIVKSDLAAVYRQLEVLQEQMIKATLTPKEARPPMSESDAREAMALLRDPKLLKRLLADFEACGVVGERTNKLVAALAAVSRLLDDPLAIIIQSSSAAGKTKLMDAVLDFAPEEERVRYSAMTGQSLFYFEGKSLKHKILAISEEEGAERASYALKLLQSEGKLTIASTGKNPQTGRLETQEYHVEGPVMIFLTTTSVEIDEELLNRCIVLTVDEDREQTRAIHELQRRAETLEGLLAREEREEILGRWRNAQRLLRPMRVVNDHAKALKFPDASTRMRRDHTKYLALIRSIALIHQKQRPVKSYVHRGRTIEYIEVIRSDIALANELANEVLGRSLDELAPQTRRLLMMLSDLVTAECKRLAMPRSEYRLTNRRIREHSGWSDFQVRIHMHKLVQMEYVLVHRGGRGQSFVYELLYDGQGRDGRRFVMGLIEPTTLLKDKNEHQKQENEHRKQDNEPTPSPERAKNGGGTSIGETSRNTSRNAAFPKLVVKKLKNAHPEGNGKDASQAERASQPAATLRRAALLRRRRIFAK